jgi:hypothetical protein
MGLDFDVVKGIISKLIERANIAPDKQHLFHGSELPPNFNPAVIISDMTPDVVKLIMVDRSATDYNKSAENGEYTKIEASSVTDMQRRVVQSFLEGHPNFGQVNTWVFLLDTPREVPVAKACEQAKRTELPYSNRELRTMGILPHDEYNYLPVPSFGRDSVWALDMKRLWSTRTMKPLVGQFFMNCLMNAISEVKLTAKTAGVDVFAEGAWPRDGLIMTSVGSRRKTFVPLAERPPGETDIKVLQYLTPSFGHTFLLRSDDGDFQCIILLHYMRLILSGIWEHNDLPVIWIDRTVHPAINANKSNPFRYVNVRSFLRLIRNVNNLEKIESHEQAMDLASIIVATCAAMSLRKSDFPEPFVESFYDKNAGKKEDVDEGELLLEIVDNSARSANGKKTKKTKKDGSATAPSFFSVTKVIALSSAKHWIDSFRVTLERVTGLINVKLSTDALQKVLEKELSINAKKHPCRVKHFRTNVLKLKWMLDYWCNAAIRIDMDVRGEKTSSGTITPYRYQAAELGVANANGKRRPIHGWKMVPCDPVENSTTVFEIPLEDDVLRSALFKESDMKAQATVYFKVV